MEVMEYLNPIVNIVSIFVLVYKIWQEIFIVEKLQNISVWESSSFTEHGDKKTEYLRILRIVTLRFLKPTEQESLTYKLTTRIFSPKPLTTQPEGTTSTAAGRDNREEGATTAAISEKSFEDLQALEGRVNSWLIRSGRFHKLDGYLIQEFSGCRKLFSKDTAQNERFVAIGLNRPLLL